ncbi:hypothetical protein GCM10027055_21090 [Janibacter alkaliphilus]|uniref:Uncharacterized protein n=1 Tax=Janibacter alkaliphilus TaxID=1069963 RepID=A0A852XCZ5_9MICO|nr:hypothetical protein [Janibacter alkaliphilus]NYG38583.1 hypothetical protein [Janibacter alkaliphilus]
MTTPATRGAGIMWTVRLLVLAFMGAAPLFALIMLFIADPGQPPSTAVVIGLLVLNVATFVVAELVGYRTPAIQPGTPPERAVGTASAALVGTTMVRAAITESPVIFALILTFVATPSTIWTYLAGAVPALLVMAVHAWPNRRVIRRLEASLDRDGGRSHLSDLAAGRAPGHGHGGHGGHGHGGQGGYQPPGFQQY